MGPEPKKKSSGLGCMIVGLCILGAGAVKVIEFIFSVSFGPVVLILVGALIMLFATFIHQP